MVVKDAQVLFAFLNPSKYLLLCLTGQILKKIILVVYDVPEMSVANIFPDVFLFV